MDVALQAQLGVEYTVPRSGVSLGVGYRVGRYDFTQSGTAPLRLEQVAGLVASVGYRLGQ